MAQCINQLLKISSRILRRPSTHCNFSISKCLRENYEGDGKTTVSILNREYKELIMFDSYSNKGFRLNNGLFILGTVAAFPRTVLHWNVENMETLTPECFSLFCVLEPRLDILILGTGDKVIHPSTEIRSFLKEHKISVEILPTHQACSTFNFLNAEGRCVAGAFFPTTVMQLYDEDQKLIFESEIASPVPSFKLPS